MWPGRSPTTSRYNQSQASNRRKRSIRSENTPTFDDVQSGHALDSKVRDLKPNFDQDFVLYQTGFFANHE